MAIITKNGLSKRPDNRPIPMPHTIKQTVHFQWVLMTEVGEEFTQESIAKNDPSILEKYQKFQVLFMEYFLKAQELIKEIEPE